MSGLKKIQALETTGAGRNRIKNGGGGHEVGGIPDSQTLRELYRLMLKIRKVELKIEELYPQDEMKTPIHLCIGQEAVPAGVCANLNADDYVFSNHRGHGHYIAKGGDLKAMVAELYGKETGCSRGRGGSMHLVDTSVGLMGSSSIVCGGVPIATGAALSSLMQVGKKVSVVFFGDGAVEEGVLYESVNFAVLKKLPIIFVCENNFYSVCSPLNKRQPNGEIYGRFKGLSIPSCRVDGTSVVDVYNSARKAIANARAGGGPSFLECTAYRWRGHGGAGSDVNLGYRTQEELEAWVVRCPVKNFERFLVEKDIMTSEEIAGVAASLEQEIDDAFKFARSSPAPDGSEISRDVYA